jgi:hypothetical protein
VVGLAAARERREYLTVIEIELGVSDLGIGLGHGGIGLLPVRLAQLHVLHGTGLIASQLISPAEFTPGVGLAGNGALQLSFGLGQPDVERHRVNAEQQHALLHLLPILEVNAGQRAADLGPQFNFVDSGKLPQKAETVFQVAHQRPACSDLG